MPTRQKTASRSLPERLYTQLSRWRRCVKEISGITAGASSIAYHIAKIVLIVFFSFAVCRCLIDGKFPLWLSTIPAIQAVNIIRDFFKSRSHNS